MIELVRYDEKERWNTIVKSFSCYDVYYLCEYAVSFLNVEDGTPYLLNYIGEDVHLCYPIIEKDIADFEAFKGYLEKDKYYDWNTPYGYGGPLSDSLFTDDQKKVFMRALIDFANHRGIISQFIRFHPLLQNHKLLEGCLESVYVKDTIFINLETKDDLMVQMDSKNRNLIRKAQKNGVVIEHDCGSKIDKFMEIYNMTMDRDHARSFYYFPKSYYEYMSNNMSYNTEYFYAYKDEKMIAASIFFYDEKFMHYHLSANTFEGRTFAPTNLLLYTAANWGRDLGIKKLHLGGGVGIEDSLFHFKKQFNKNGRIEFWMGRTIFNESIYNELLKKRKEINSSFDMSNMYYIQYRQP